MKKKTQRTFWTATSALAALCALSLGATFVPELRRYLRLRRM